MFKSTYKVELDHVHRAVYRDVHVIYPIRPPPSPPPPPPLMYVYNTHVRTQHKLHDSRMWIMLHDAVLTMNICHEATPSPPTPPMNPLPCLMYKAINPGGHNRTPHPVCTPPAAPPDSTRDYRKMLQLYITTVTVCTSVHITMVMCDGAHVVSTTTQLLLLHLSVSQQLRRLDQLCMGM